MGDTCHHILILPEPEVDGVPKESHHVNYVVVLNIMMACFADNASAPETNSIYHQSIDFPANCVNPNSRRFVKRASQTPLPQLAD